MNFVTGWILVKWLFLEININKYNPLRASSYIPLPVQLQLKRGVVNVQNSDSFCFGWALASSICAPTGSVNRTSSYVHFNTLFNFEGIEFPVKLRDIAKFESQNPLSVNVYGIELVIRDGKTLYEIVGPLHYTSNKKLVHRNLLLLSDSEGNNHYCWIKNFSRLLSKQINSRHGAKYFCDGCLNYFTSEQKLSNHCRHDCERVAVTLPTITPKLDKSGKEVPGNVLKFQNYHRQLPIPFVIYADFETLLKPIDTVTPSPDKPFTVKTCEHVPYSFAYYIKCLHDDSLSKFELYRGPDAPRIFLERLERDVHNLYHNHLKIVKPMLELDRDQILNFETATACSICENPFTPDDSNSTVRDHCHLTGNYRGAAHNACNLNFKIPNFVPIFFHNLGYDNHLFVKELALHNEQLDVIAQNKEKYVSFSKHMLVDEIEEDGKLRKVFFRLRFVDSFRFMNSSLAELAQNLPSDEFVEIRKYFVDDLKCDVMRKKGVFPYSYVDSFSKLDEPTLPSREQFYDSLRDEDISDEDYNRAQQVWHMFACKTLGQYSDIYLQSDVLILASVFENFRKVSIKNYKLDPAHFLTLPGYTWDAMLKFTNVELELLTDIDMFHFFKKGIRGGVSSCISRKAIANNQFVPQYDPAQPKVFIAYLDATNLYGYSMIQYLPQSNFTWLSPPEIENFIVNDVDDESNWGYVLEVDLHYPPTLHDLHNDLPFCPENMVPPVPKATMSKLIPNLYDKSKYILHYRNLKQCLSHGLILTKTYRILKFRQSPWLKPYIDFNTALRNVARNSFEKNHCKLLNNAMFGKTMENVDKRCNVKLISHWENVGRRLGVEAYVAKPSFKNLSIFSENLAAIELNKVSVMYDKPVYVGFTVLDVSKTVIYDFYFNFLKQLYGDRVSLLYTDTDSLVLKINTENFYEDVRQNIVKYDTSNFSPDNIYNIPITTSVLGKMKDEYGGLPVRSFYGVGAKSYCVDVVGKKNIVKKAKGVGRNAIQKNLSGDDYKSIVENKAQIIFCNMYIFRSTLHTMYTELKNKVALSAKDDKRFVIPGSTETLAWGHTDLSNDRLNNLIEMLETFPRNEI